MNSTQLWNETNPLFLSRQDNKYKEVIVIKIKNYDTHL